jgi:peptide/nickel transport system substrate-binding protein
VLGCVTALLVALGVSGGCTRPDRGEHALVVGLESMPTNLDPRFATDAASSRIDDLVFRSLTRVDQHQRHVPDLAVAWQSAGPLEVRFQLRADATFSDGTPLTAADVRATYESILDPATGSPKREDLAFLRVIEATDDHTVVFRLRAPFAPFLEATTIGILPRARLEPGERVLIGAGPFRIASLQPGQEVRLVARPDRSGIPEIRFRIIPDDTVRTLELAKGNVDLVENAVEPDNVRWLETHSATCVLRIPGSTFQYLGINFHEAVLSDLRVRRAVVQAIDRTALIEHLLDGTARAATGLLSPEHWAYEGDVVRYPYDPAAARRLLDAAGYPDPDGDGPRMRLRLSYKTSTLDSRRRMGEALQAMLAAVGIGLDLRSFEWATFYDDIRRGNFQLYSLAWVGITDPDFFFTLMHSTMTPPRGSNRGGYADPEIDRLTSLGRRAMDPSMRRSIYAEVQRRAARDLPFIPLWWTDNVVVRSRRLCGFVPRPDGSLASLATAWLDSAADRPEAGPCGCGGLS